MDAKAAREAGALFYDLPEEINLTAVDPLIWPIIERINESKIVRTAESCQGHPESPEPRWADNTDPMLRLVYAAADEGRVLSALLQASRSMELDPPETEAESGGMTRWGRPGTTPLKLYPDGRGQPDWCELLVYIPAANVFYRNRGLETLRRFADLVCKEPLK